MGESKPALVVFELHHLGDVLMSFPFIRGALERFEVWVICLPGTAKLYEEILPQDRIFVWRPLWQGGSWKETMKALGLWKNIRAEVSVCVWADVRVHGLMFRSGNGKRVGFPMNRANYYAHERAWRKRQLLVGKILQGLGGLLSGGRLLTEKLRRKAYQQHHVEDWRQIADCLGLPFRTDVPWLETDSRRVPEPMAAFLKAVRLQGKKVWMIHSGGRLPSKQWPAERFKEVLETYFRPAGIACVVLGENWANSSSDDLTWYASPMDLGAFIATMGQVDAFLGNDSFPAHLAAALGKRVVAIFGSGNPSWFAPWGNQSSSIAAKNCPYWPCVDRCQMPSYVCLEAVQVRDVVTILST